MSKSVRGCATGLTGSVFLSLSSILLTVLLGIRGTLMVAVTELASDLASKSRFFSSRDANRLIELVLLGLGGGEIVKVAEIF